MMVAFFSKSKGDFLNFVTVRRILVFLNIEDELNSYDDVYFIAVK